MLGIIKKFFSRSTDNDISYNELINIIKATDRAILIDVRSKQEYDEGHLNGAINIPVYEIENKILNIVKDKSVNIIVYCQSGGRSLKAKKSLEKLGYLNVYNLKGGIDSINKV